MKFSVLCLVVLAAAVSAQKPCCAPNQFMGGNGVTYGQSGKDGALGLIIYQYGAWDFKDRRLGYDMTVFFPSNGTASNFRIIQNWAENVQWFILDSAGYCLKQAVPKTEPNNCVPTNATLSSSSYLGGEEGILVDGFSFMMSPPQDDRLGLATYSGVRESCFPIGSSFIGKSLVNPESEVDEVYTTGWVNVTVGIPEPARWFSVPPFCKADAAEMALRRPKFLPDFNLISHFGRLF